MRKRPEKTGFLGPLEQHEGGPGAVCPTPPWATDELVAETRRVWTSAYGRVVAAEEAVEILMNIRRLAFALADSQQEGKNE